MEDRICVHCKDPLSPYASKKAKYCGKPECKAIRRSISDKKRYPRKPKFCTVCGCVITDLWPDTICSKQSCIDAYDEKKKFIISRKSTRYYNKHIRKKRKKCEICKKVIPRGVHGTSKTCGREKCIEKRTEIVKATKKLRYNIRMSKKKARTERLKVKVEKRQKQQEVTPPPKKPSLFDSNSEDYFDNDMFLAKQKELKKKNGRRCQKCKKALTGNYRNHCRTCRPTVERLANGVNDSWI